MDTSTPVKATPVKTNNLHRRTLLKNALDSPHTLPLRRRSVLQTPITLEKSNESNDESERSTRRSLVDIQRRVSNISHQASPLNEIKTFGEQEMKDHFQICTKLFAENKITPKNAWQLHIIDLLRHMSQKTTGDTLQIASTSLDISAKVYGIRVDTVHADGLKLASTMARVSEKENLQQIGEDGDGEGVVEGEKDNAAAKKKKKKKRLTAGEKNTIAKDPKTLKAPLPKLESVFFATRTNAETSAIDNLFTNTLPMDHAGYKFMLLSKEKAWPTGPDPTIDPKIKNYTIDANALQDITICKTFKDFIINEWDPAEEEKQLPELSIQRDNEVVFDDNGIPIAELDGSIHDIFDDNDQNCMDVEEEEDKQEECAQIRGEIAHIVDFAPNSMNNKTEYSYNSIVSTHSGKVIDQIWAGPSHWKLKFIRRSNLRFSGQITEKVVKNKKKTKSQPQTVDFFTDDDDDEDERLSKTKLKIKKKPPTVDPQKITLPLADKFSLEFMERIGELMSKPGSMPIRSKPASETQQIDYEVKAYNYENLNDSQYCSQHTEDNDPGNPDDYSDAEEMAVAAQENFLGENLVNAPELVPKSCLIYALQAKKMDMKKLKNAVYNILTENYKSIEITDNNMEIVPTNFAKLYTKLPKLLSEKMRSELSCPLALFAVLHLANEKSLTLTQHLDYKNFDIAGPTRTVKNNKKVMS